MKKTMVATLLVLSLMGTLAGCSASGTDAAERQTRKVRIQPLHPAGMRRRTPAWNLYT